MGNDHTGFSKEIRIGEHRVGPGRPTFIIAEAGVNHGGDIRKAFELIDIAADAGANAVKFQAFRTEHVILKSVEKAPYQKQTTDKSESQFEMIRKLELKKEQYVELKAYCARKKIFFLITPFDEPSLRELEEVGVEAYKISSTDTTNLPFLKKVAQTRKPLLLSTGMCYLNEVEAALQEIKPWNRDVILLQCTANYPILDEEAHLNVITTFKERFDVLVGYSDHSVGIGASLYAVPMGAVVLEKHFTIDKNLPGPDHRASLSPSELKDFVKQVRHIEVYLGSPEKKPVPSEVHTRNSLQKCLVAARPIKKGQIIADADLVAKRTGGKGISPLKYRDVTGTVAIRDFAVNDIIELSK
jgi:N-acetylneuraminate synthase